MYREEQLVGIAKRENNKKRGYLVVNRLQGKHIPVRPKEALQMFSELAQIIGRAYAEEKLLLVGFAETATAIGAAAAAKLGTLYIQTTREEISGVEYLYFSESHSHATEQKLVRDDIDRVKDQIDRVVFVEDEVTTGNTILKIIDILEREYPGKMTYAVASLLNGMSGQALNTYRERGIPVHYLVKTDHEPYTEIAEQYKGDGIYVGADDRRFEKMPGKFREIKAVGCRNARRCVSAQEYVDACEELWKETAKSVSLVDKEKILVLGTEEFMYPALYAAAKLEESGKTVRFHATTRSPIEVSSEEEYPLHARYELKSLYDEGRRTFIYDLDRYDAVLILTDAPGDSPAGVCTLANALAACGNEEIILVRWCDV